MTFLEELQWRNLLKDVTDMEGLQERIKEPMSVYCGFDPTANSLHVGHLQQILLLRRYQMQGHQPIALIGGATGMIGDPRPTSERKMQTLEMVAENVTALKAQLSHFLNFNDENGAKLLNNHDWLASLNILDFLRIYGKHFNVSYMLAKDNIASRLSTGISFTEFTYTILQAADWLHLYQNHNCTLQIGGSDQWGNLTSGSELIRKIVGPEAKVFGATSPLITKSDGTKFGKSEGGNVWLDATLTSPYEFYQFWINTADVDVINFLKRLTFLSKEEIDALEVSMQEQPHLREAQKALAKETTILVHSEAAYESALRISQALFGGDFTTLNKEELAQALAGFERRSVSDNISLVECLVEAKICKSNREARELINGGSIAINGEKQRDVDFVVSKENAILDGATIIKKGKKFYFVVEQ
ncbi:MAG: tyrosine--tRNA ligase [Erysipelotrichaceae bacterium]